MTNERRWDDDTTDEAEDARRAKRYAEEEAAMGPTWTRAQYLGDRAD